MSPSIALAERGGASKAPTAADALAGQVARLFFDRQLSKIEIATRLGISRFRVARLLDKALADGIVRIEFRDAPATDRDLARALAERFGLDRCIVAAGPDDPQGAAAQLAAGLLEGLLERRGSIGVAWGSTVTRVVASMPPRADPSIDVVQLAGNSAAMGTGTAPGDTTRLLAGRLGARAHAIHAPTFVESSSLRKALAREPEIAETFAWFDRLSVAVVGIGAFGLEPGEPVGRPSSSLLRSGAFQPADLAGLEAAGAVGDLLVHPFDVDGRFVAPDLAARAMAISVRALRKVPRVVAVATGADKAVALRGALRTGIVHMLVTDVEAATRLLDIERP
ncbi:MAG: sugar-binding domain-containing protein [Chloroflexota bacterium]